MITKISKIFKISKISKLILMLTVTFSLTIGFASVTFGATDPTLNVLQKYSLVNTYVITNTKNGDSGNLLNTKATIILGTDVLSPYILSMSDFKVSEGTVSKDANGVYTLTDLISSTAPNTFHTITIERTFTTGTINYNIDKSTITAAYSGLPNYTDYLKAAVKIEVNDAGIQAKAKALTQNITNQYDKAFAIFKFVNTSMTYDLNSPYANTGAVSALAHKVGVCEDYSELYVALCRASGIPSRTVSGYRNWNGGSSTTIDVTSERHMWAEVYFPNYGWTIVEPTVSFSRAPSDSDLLNYFGKALTPAEHIATGYDYVGGTSVSSSYDRSTVYKPSISTVGTAALYVVDTSNDALDAATSAVTKAETSKSQSDLDSAKVLVVALSDSTDKTSLLSRIDALQKTINDSTANSNSLATATSAVTSAETSKLQSDLDSSKVLVVALPDSTDKASLLSRINALQKTIDNSTANSNALVTATSAVTKAETSKLQSDLDSAKVLVVALPDSTDKASLLSRIDALLKTINDSIQIEYRNIIEATRLSAIAYQTPTRNNYNIALIAVNNLKDGTNKSSLQRMLVSILKVIVTNETNATSQDAAIKIATSSVVKAEGSNLQLDVNAAKILISKMVTSIEKSDLTNRINAVQVIVTANINNTAITVATVAVVKAEGSKLQVDVNSARILISRIITSTEKTNLTNRTNAVQIIITANVKRAAIVLATT
ncbi:MULTISPECIES: transglutaminase-like domain-containing protein [Clostridium]|uniref:Transglutaminase-like domain-containing protein n=1 Tax=Clostridium frigoriphilum TaxID=443253 RepID=A0ABU7UXA9_9CLOT|nr:transglutaminase-like domain-containing protein [Clostridium sp. DSM 17811]MBU3101786.1 transglutaminase-like domain-containing protein [Clostridium sp. DSM 17811]